MYTYIFLLFGKKVEEINQIVFKNAKKMFANLKSKLRYIKNFCSVINYGLK